MWGGIKKFYKKYKMPIYGGVLTVAVILMLYNTIHNIIRIVGLREEHYLIYDEDEVEKED